MSSSSTEPPDTPPLSAVVISFNGEPLLTRCLEALGADTAGRDVDVLVVADWHHRGGRPSDRLTQAFPSVRWMEAPAGSTVPRLRSIGIAGSVARIVAVIEDDCVVEPGWCDALMAAHGAREGAVAGAVEPGPYRRALDWAVYFCDHARFMMPLRAGPAAALPGNNMSFTRGALARLPLDTATGFHEFFGHRAWRRAGMPVHADPAVRVRNVNRWSIAHVTRVPYHHGRALAGQRVAGQAMWRRLPMSALALLLLPVVKLARLTREIVSRRRLLGPFLASLPWMIVLSTSWSLGEAIGYLCGPGESPSNWR